MMLRPKTPKVTTQGTLMQMKPLNHDAYKQYIEDKYFKELFKHMQGQVHEEEGDKKDDYNLQDRFLYNMDKLCDERSKNETHKRGSYLQNCR